MKITEEGESYLNEQLQGGEYKISPRTGEILFVPDRPQSYYETIQDTIEQFQEEHGEKDIEELIELFSNTYEPSEIEVAQNLEQYNFS